MWMTHIWKFIHQNRWKKSHPKKPLPKPNQNNPKKPKNQNNTKKKQKRKNFLQVQLQLTKRNLHTFCGNISWKGCGRHSGDAQWIFPWKCTRRMGIICKGDKWQTKHQNWPWKVILLKNWLEYINKPWNSDVLLGSSVAYGNHCGPFHQLRVSWITSHVLLSVPYICWE